VALMSPDMIAGIGILRGGMAAVLLVAFIALWVWAYSGRRRAAFEAAAHLPLEDDAQASHGVGGRDPSRGDLRRGIPQ